jgi:hypothetical protein
MDFRSNTGLAVPILLLDRLLGTLSTLRATEWCGFNAIRKGHASTFAAFVGDGTPQQRRDVAPNALGFLDSLRHFVIAVSVEANQ